MPSPLGSTPPLQPAILMVSYLDQSRNGQTSRAEDTGDGGLHGATCDGARSLATCVKSVESLHIIQGLCAILPAALVKLE